MPTAGLRFSTCVLMIAGYLSQGAAFPEKAPGHESVELRELLARMDRVARSYRKIALKFACVEDIEYRFRLYREQHRFNYVFSLDEEVGLLNTRTKWRRKPPRNPQKIKPFDLDRLDFPVLQNSLIWIYTFRRDRQVHHDYEYLGEAELFGRTAAKIGFAPRARPIHRINEWIGTAWVDVETAQILKVQAYHYHQYQKYLMAETAAEERLEDARPRTHGWEVVTTEFESLVRGLRFPSRSIIEGRSVRFPEEAWEDSRTDFRVTQRYSQYEFFSVESEEFVPGLDTGAED